MNKRAIILILLALPLLLLAGCDDDDIVAAGAVPAIPSGVYSVTHDGYVTIAWNENRDDGLTEGYGVYYYSGDVDGYEQYELMTTVDADPGSWYAFYEDHDVDNGVTYKYAVNAYNEYGESELSYEDIEDTPRPEGNASVYDYETKPEQAGFDFSRFGPVDWEDPQADVFFEYDPYWDLFYVNVAGEDYELVDIQDFGYVESIYQVDSADVGGGWSPFGWVTITEGHAYLVWTADDHYAAFRVNSANGGTGRVGITWAYQTQYQNGELKRAVPQRPEHAENYGRREK